MADDLISAILEQVRAIRTYKSSFHIAASVQIELLVNRMKLIRCMIDSFKNWPLSAQPPIIEIDCCAFDDVLYDTEDVFSGFNSRLMQSNLQTDAAEALKVSEVKTKHTDYFESSISKLEVELMDLRSNICPGPESFLVEVTKLYGIDQVKKGIMDVILGKSNKERSQNITTISIVGTEGMGKTSLAQCICEDEQVAAGFDNIILVNASYDFDLGKIARAIIQALEGLKHDFLCILTLVPLQSLLDRIYRKIVDKKSLLVLDGVERYDCDDWQALKAVFQHGKSESRIVITTREHKYAVAMESSYIFHLNELPDELCWMILREVAFDGLNEDSHEYVEDIGLEIAKKCKGSPFAAKVLGGVLQHKIEKKEWNSVLENYVWKSMMIPKYIFKILWLSYCDLPWSIRRCLLYCVIFPKNFEMSITLLVQHWMAQGYLNSSDDSEMELKGEGYFKCLVAHSFLQDFRRNGGIHTWKMHNIVHDFVRFLSRSELMMEIKSVEHMRLKLTSSRTSMEVKAAKRLIPDSAPAPAPKQMKTLSDSGTSNLPSSCDPPSIPQSSCPPLLSVSPISIRHLILMIAQGAGFPVDISGAEKLRTLVAVGQGCFITSGALSNLFRQSKHLRLLDLSLSSGWHNCFGPCGQGNILHKLPDEIYGLINLKFLSLAGSKELKILPETLCDLYNLQSLDLNGCSSLTKLPDGMGKLMKLRYLVTWYCSSITFYPKGIGCLTSLRELTNVIVRVDQNDAKEFSLGDFEELNHLCGDVRVKLVGNAIDADEAIRANLSSKKSLNNVRINLDGDIKENDVIKALNSPSELKIEFIGWWF